MQTIAPFEILVGDDSRDDASRAVVEDFAATAPFPIRYFKRSPPIGQAGNVHHLFQEARGELVCLIHDDDMLALKSLEVLSPCFENPEVAMAFGKHVIINHDGSENKQATEIVNRCFHRTPGRAGIQEDFHLSALVQQIPNNGFLVRGGMAREVGYLEPAALLGDACDHAFAILCALKRPKARACFVDEFTTYYRMTQVSVSRGRRQADNAYRTFRYLTGQEPEPEHREALHRWLCDRSAVAVNQAINLGHVREAWSWYFSRWHRAKIATPGGAKRLLRLLVASVMRRGTVGRQVARTPTDGASSMSST